MNSTSRTTFRALALIASIVFLATNDCLAVDFMMVDAGAGGYERNGVHVMFDANQGEDTIAIITAKNQAAPTDSQNPFVSMASTANGRELRAGTNGKGELFFRFDKRNNHAGFAVQNDVEAVSIELDSGSAAVHYSSNWRCPVIVFSGTGSVASGNLQIRIQNSRVVSTTEQGIAPLRRGATPLCLRFQGQRTEYYFSRSGTIEARLQ